MLKMKMLLAAALIAVGSTAAFAQAGSSGAGGSTGAGASSGGAGVEAPRPSDAHPPGALYQGGSGEITTGRGDDMKPIRTAPTGMDTGAPSSRVHGYRVRHGRARPYSQ